MLRITITTLFTLTILVAGPACHRCKKNFLRNDPVPRNAPTGGGIYLSEPLPTSPGLSDPIIPNSSSGSYRLEQGPPPTEWMPESSGSNRVLPAPPLPSESRKEQWLPEPPSGSGAPPVIDLRGASRVEPTLGEPIRSSRKASPSNQTSRQPKQNQPRGLPGYHDVAGRSKVATGQRATLDGLDWLKDNNYKTVVYLHESTNDLDSARTLIEDRGLRFVPIDVQPMNLASAYDQFVKVVNVPSSQPVYVSDEDGQLAGALWYLTFRMADLRGYDTARILATGLGLPSNVGEDQKQWWLAIQNVLASR